MTSPLAALNERYTHTCFRLETLQDYAGVSREEQERVASWLRGQREFRSVSEDSYLARAAKHTLEGKRRSRVHVVTLPLSDYMRYELDAYRENVAVGEQISIADAQAIDTPLGPDFWLFDAGTPTAEAVIMHYDPVTVEVLEFEHLTRGAAPNRIAELERQASVAQRAARPLDRFLSDLSGTELAARAS
ncbi:DUF6879 family protein [Actinomycetospora soli]|uniref:DUF6879 family protein n=1 Tax=Actinomycetospora soli TaxID=2893887 RepID=UPI001E39FC13|nr:DUF6879 family protein [Actinomycetospora soli]MCD2191599.1 hypothetical protein [Actinomycetospora soli]